MSGQGAKPPIKITYATMSGDQLEELHGALDAAIPAVQAAFGQTHPLWINGHAVKTVDHFTDTSPFDTRIVLGEFAKGSQLHVRDAINAARAAFPAWSRTSWPDRVKLLRRVAVDPQRVGLAEGGLHGGDGGVEGSVELLELVPAHGGVSDLEWRFRALRGHGAPRSEQTVVSRRTLRS
jgi:hypothetical protein